MTHESPGSAVSSWLPELSGAGAPVYRSIADAIDEDVRSGRLQPGDRLPTHRELARRLGVNVVTITRAYAEAARRGLISGEVGRGTFVRARDDATTPLTRLQTHAHAIDMALNVPAPDGDVVDLRPFLASWARRPEQVPLFTSYFSHGLPEHREAGARWVRALTGHAVDAGRVSVCSGAQHALTTVLMTIAAPDDVLLTEDLCYPGMIALASLLRLRLASVATDRGGLLPDAFEAAARRTRARALYVMPSISNPTGTVLSTERREAIVAVARRHDVAILEDHTYGFLVEPTSPPLLALAPELTWFVESTSKSLAAGLRIGYLVAPETPEHAVTMSRVAGTIAATTWMAAPMMAALAAQWIEGGTAARLVESKRRAAALRRGLFDARLGHLGTVSHPASCHVWLRLPSPWSGESFAARAHALGVGVTSAESFVVGRREAPAAVRVCLGTPPTTLDVDRGLSILAHLLEDETRAKPPLV